MFSDLVSVAGHIYKHGVDDGLPGSLAGGKVRINLHADEFNELIGDEFIPMVNKAGGAGVQVTAYTPVSYTHLDVYKRQVEYRGGERFLSVAPPGSTQLSQIYLIRQGDAVAGTTWRLTDLDDRTAHFDVAGASRSVRIQP